MSDLAQCLIYHRGLVHEMSFVNIAKQLQFLVTCFLSNCFEEEQNGQQDTDQIKSQKRLSLYNDVQSVAVTDVPMFTF